MFFFPMNEIDYLASLNAEVIASAESLDDLAFDDDALFAVLKYNNSEMTVPYLLKVKTFYSREEFITLIARALKRVCCFDFDSIHLPEDKKITYLKELREIQGLLFGSADLPDSIESCFHVSADEVVSNPFPVDAKIIPVLIHRYSSEVEILSFVFKYFLDTGIQAHQNLLIQIAFEMLVFNDSQMSAPLFASVIFCAEEYQSYYLKGLSQPSESLLEQAVLEVEKCDEACKANMLKASGEIASSKIFVQLFLKKWFSEKTILIVLYLRLLNLGYWDEPILRNSDLLILLRSAGCDFFDESSRRVTKEELFHFISSPKKKEIRDELFGAAVAADSSDLLMLMLKNYEINFVTLVRILYYFFIKKESFSPELLNFPAVLKVLRDPLGLLQFSISIYTQVYSDERANGPLMLEKKLAPVRKVFFGLISLGYTPSGIQFDLKSYLADQGIMSLVCGNHFFFILIVSLLGDSFERYQGRFRKMPSFLGVPCQVISLKIAYELSLTDHFRFLVKEFFHTALDIFLEKDYQNTYFLRMIVDATPRQLPPENAKKLRLLKEKIKVIEDSLLTEILGGDDFLKSEVQEKLPVKTKPKGRGKKGTVKESQAPALEPVRHVEKKSSSVIDQGCDHEGSDLAGWVEVKKGKQNKETQPKKKKSAIQPTAKIGNGVFAGGASAGAADAAATPTPTPTLTLTPTPTTTLVDCDEVNRVDLSGLPKSVSDVSAVLLPVLDVSRPASTLTVSSGSLSAGSDTAGSSSDDRREKLLEHAIREQLRLAESLSDLNLRLMVLQEQRDAYEKYIASYQRVSGGVGFFPAPVPVPVFYSAVAPFAVESQPQFWVYCSLQRIPDSTMLYAIYLIDHDAKSIGVVRVEDMVGIEETQLFQLAYFPSREQPLELFGVSERRHCRLITQISDQLNLSDSCQLTLSFEGHSSLQPKK